MKTGDDNWDAIQALIREIGELKKRVSELESKQPPKVEYTTPPPKADLCWLETAHFMPTDCETVLLAWPRKEGFIFRTGFFAGDKWYLNAGNESRQKPVFFAAFNEK